MAKPKLAVYWAASCGGCDIAILDIDEKILEVADFFDLVFWPCAMDFKYDDIRKMQDKEITLTLFNGAIRSDENYEIAKLLGRSRLCCASVAPPGCIPDWRISPTNRRSWTMSQERRLRWSRAAASSPSECQSREGTLHIPNLWNWCTFRKWLMSVTCPRMPPQSNSY
jgi:F420-non-reducing hydrogenase small subunit